jgi:hypothetical protein
MAAKEGGAESARKTGVLEGIPTRLATEKPLAEDRETDDLMAEEVAAHEGREETGE